MALANSLFASKVLAVISSALRGSNRSGGHSNRLHTDNVPVLEVARTGRFRVSGVDFYKHTLPIGLVVGDGLVPELPSKTNSQIESAVLPHRFNLRTSLYAGFLRSVIYV